MSWQVLRHEQIKKGNKEMIDIIQICTNGITGISFAVLLTFIFTNICKSGSLGSLSDWVTYKNDIRENRGERVLFVNLCFSIVLNMLQALAIMAIGDSISRSMVILRILASAMLASGGYEYIKTISNSILHKN